MTETLALRDAKTIDELCRLKRDNMSYGDFWLLSDGYNVTICQQKVGESPHGSVSVPRHIFNRMVDFYCKPQPAKPRKRTR